MAVFGLPVAHDDDPARALSAALDLRDRVQADPALGRPPPDPARREQRRGDRHTRPDRPTNSCSPAIRSTSPLAFSRRRSSGRSSSVNGRCGPPGTLRLRLADGDRGQGQVGAVPAQRLLGRRQAPDVRPRHPLVGRERRSGAARARRHGARSRSVDRTWSASWLRLASGSRGFSRSSSTVPASDPQSRSPSRSACPMANG